MWNPEFKRVLNDTDVLLGVNIDNEQLICLQDELNAYDNTPSIFSVKITPLILKSRSKRERRLRCCNLRRYILMQERFIIINQ